jgi:hypothetical protein
LIRYLYREITEEEKTEIDNALICDGELRALFNEVSATLKGMDAAALEPSDATVFSILNYSRSLQHKDR